MQLKKLLVTLVLTSGAFAAGAAELSGNVTFGSDYVYRGISQTDEEPTIQGGFDAVSDSGLYAGVWASNVAFDGSIEIDYYVGFSQETEVFTYDIGFIHYNYPNQPQGQPDSNFSEVYGSITVRGFTAGLAVSNDFFGETGSATYASIDYEMSLPNDLSLTLHYGAQSIDDGEDYDDYSVSLGKTVSDFDLALTWHDTDLDGNTCADICDSRVVLTVSKSL